MYRLVLGNKTATTFLLKKNFLSSSDEIDFIKITENKNKFFEIIILNMIKKVSNIMKFALSLTYCKREFRN